MESIRIFLLSLVQAATEFLPVSSSGHLVLAKGVLGVDSAGAGLELFLHVGTLVSVCVFYRARVARLLSGLFAWRAEAVSYAGYILVSMLPAAIFGLACEDVLKGLYGKPVLVCALLILNGIVLLVAGLREKRAAAAEASGEGGGAALTWKRALCMGLGQAFAVLPGISRSGSSITAGRLTGLGPAAAAEFSFLMSVPVIGGAAALDLVTSIRETGVLVQGVSTGDAAMGFVVAAVVGFFALRILDGLLRRGRFWIFGPYCILVGTVGLIAFS